MPNSVEGRDIAYQMHPNVNLRAYEKTGGLVIESGDGIYVTDNNGKRYIEAMAGLWSVALGFGEKRLAAVAKAQMEKLPYYHTFGFRSHGPSIDRQDGVVPLQRARQTGQEEDHRPPQGLSRRDHRRRVDHRPATQPREL
jgi:adenosylmethionine-8-amino-7-oxononanoate aminotransferase